MVSPTFTSEPSTLGWRSPRDSHRKNCRENPGPVLQKLWHIETTPFKEFMTNIRKWKKLAHVPSFPMSTVKPKSYRDKTQMSFVREMCIAFFPKWSLNFQIADTCTHCVPIFGFASHCWTNVDVTSSEQIQDGFQDTKYSLLCCKYKVNNYYNYYLNLNQLVSNSKQKSINDSVNDQSVSTQIISPPKLHITMRLLQPRPSDKILHKFSK